jgi:hypothetical protein
VPRQSLSQLIDAITLDAYGTDEELTGFLTVFDEQVALPCVAQILDVEVEVLAFDLEGDERRGLVAPCRRVGGCSGVVSLADVRFEPGTVAAWLHAAFRKWLGLRAFPARQPPSWTWPEP